MATKVWLGNDSGNEGDYGTAANWSPSGVPIAGDDVIFANSSQNVTASLDQSAVALSSIVFDQSFTGRIGTTDDDFLQIAASTAIIGQSRTNTGTLTGSTALNLDFGSSTACDIQVYNTASTARDSNRDPLRIRAANASTNVTVYGGRLSISDDSSDSSTIGTLRVSGGFVRVGANVTQTTVTQSAGVTHIQSDITTLTVKGGTCNVYDSTTTTEITTLTVEDAGVLNHYASGTITTANCNGGNTRFNVTEKSKTITTLNLQIGANVSLDTNNVTLTNDVILQSGQIINISTE